MFGGSDGLFCGVTEQYAGRSFLMTWAVATSLAAVQDLVICSAAFYKLYWPSQVTYAKWYWKTNPKYPTPEKVRDEIKQTLKCMVCSGLPPALSLWLHAQGDASPVTTYGFCGAEYGWAYNIFCFFVVLFATDFWMFCFHSVGHRFHFMWEGHRHHHAFFNPTPFSAIADDFLDQFCGSFPVLGLPLLLPMNLDVMFLATNLFFFGGAVQLHSGYELSWLNTHNGVVNTSYQHHLHHAISTMKKAYHCGLIFPVWDQLAGTVYKGQCFCVRCAQKKGLRSREEFAKVVVPDYSKLLQPSFWLPCFAKTETSGKQA